MNSTKKEAIVRHCTYIIQNIDAAPIMDSLQESGVFDPSDVSRINSTGKWYQDINREMLSTLYKRAEEKNPFENFIDALNNNNEKETAEKILDIYNLIPRAHCKRRHPRLCSWPFIIFASIFIGAITRVTIIFFQSNNSDIVTNAADLLRDYYRPRLFNNDSSFTTFSSTDIEQIWVNPTLEHNGKKYTHYGSLINDSFLVKDLVLFEGDAGTGKSYLLRKIMHDWTVGRFSQFKLAMYFEIRHIKTREETIEKLVTGAIKPLFHKNSTIPEDVKSAISKLIHASQSKSILIILDGYDEGPSICEELNNLLSNEDTGLLMPEAQFKVIISARTNRIRRKNDGKFSRIKILGFDLWEQKNDYIDKYFKIINNTVDSDKLKARLNSTKFLMDWSNNPLYMTFICAVFKDLKKPTELELYEKIVFNQMKVHSGKSTYYLKSIVSNCGFKFEGGIFEIGMITDEEWRQCSYLHNLGKLAFKKLFDRKGQLLEFSTADLTHYNIPMGNISDCGFLVRTDINQEIMYNFRHKSFQEFFSAFYCNTVDNQHLNDSVKWYHYILTNSSSKIGDMNHKPNEFEYFLFRYAVANFERKEASTDTMQPLLQKYTTLDLSFSKADILSEGQLKLFLLEFVNVTNLSLSGTLQNGNVSLPRMDSLRVLSFDDISFIHQNQTVSHLSMKNLPSLSRVTFRTCTRSLHEWWASIKAISRSEQKLETLKIHCSRWSDNDIEFLYNFLKETVKCSSKVKKLSIVKDPEDNWPAFDDANELMMTAALTFILDNSNFEKLEFTTHFAEHYKVKMTEFPSAKQTQELGTEIFTIKVTEHKANSTLYLNLSRWDIKTDTQLHELLSNKYRNITYLSISGQLQDGNITVPPMNELVTIEYLTIQFSYALNVQSIYVPTRKQAPKLRNIKFHVGPTICASLNQWAIILNSLSNSSLNLDTLEIQCSWSKAECSSTTIETFFYSLANCIIPIKKLQIFENELFNSQTDTEREFLIDLGIKDAIKILAHRKNINKLVLNDNFVNYFGIDMIKVFGSYNISDQDGSSFFIIDSKFRAHDVMVTTSNPTEIYENLRNDEKESQETIWRFVRLINFTHIIVRAELSYSGKTIHQIIAENRITGENGQELKYLSASISHSDLNNSYSTTAVYNCCPWRDTDKIWKAMDFFCEDPHPLLILNITFSDLSKKMHDMHLLIGHLSKLFNCKTELNQENVYILNSAELIEKNPISSRIMLRLYNITLHSKRVSQLHPLYLSAAVPVQYYLKEQNVILIYAETVAQERNENEIKHILATELYLDTSQIGLTTEQQLYLHLSRFSNLTNLTISGFFEGNMRLPPMTNLQTVTFQNVTFSQSDQKIVAFVRSQFPSLKKLTYESCPWSWGDIKNVSTASVNFFSPNLASLHILCSSLPSLEKLFIRCADWSSRNWQFIANFYLGIQNCTSEINSVYLFIYPEDQWPYLEDKPGTISMTSILKKLIEKDNFRRIIINERFRLYNDILMADLPKARRSKYLGMEVSVFEKKRKRKTPP